MKEISELEATYRGLLCDALKGDKRLEITAPEVRYPEPSYVYLKSKRTGKTIAVRLDGEDKTMRFWDYVDDDYENEDGVWENMSSEGLDKFVKKLYNVMERAVDIEFYDSNGECNDYFSAVFKAEMNEENALRAVKKVGKGKKFSFVGFVNFFGDKRFLFDKTFKLIKKQ